MSGNLLHIDGQVSAPDPLRFTPAGIPLWTFRLVHESTQLEAGQQRSVQAELPVMVLGELARRSSRLADAQPITVQGFLSRRSLKSAQLVLHAVAIEARDSATDTFLE